MNNLKLDIFGSGRGGIGNAAESKMKKLFPGKRNSKASPSIEHPGESAATGHTLDRIVNAKEEVRELILVKLYPVCYVLLKMTISFFSPCLVRKSG